LKLLLKTTKNNKFVSTYLLDIKKTVDTLAAIGVAISTEEHIEMILDDLSDEYDGFITSIISRTYPYSVDYLEVLLLAREEHFEKHKTQSSFLHANTVSRNVTVTNLANARSRFNPNSSRGGRVPSRNHGSRSNHFTNACIPNNSAPTSNMPWHTVKHPCQICGKLGHTTLRCWHKNGQSEQNSFSANMSQFPSHPDEQSSILGAPSTIIDPLWYPDSGASHHISNDSEVLSTNQPITALIKFEYVMVQVCALHILVLLNTLHRTLIRNLS